MSRDRSPRRSSRREGEAGTDPPSAAAAGHDGLVGGEAKAEGLPGPECGLGYPVAQLEQLLDGPAFRRFMLWMDGQTGVICDGRVFNRATSSYDPSGCGPHGHVVFVHDFVRWRVAGPITD